MRSCGRLGDVLPLSSRRAALDVNLELGIIDNGGVGDTPPREIRF